MITFCKENLQEIKTLLEQLPMGAYQKKSNSLSGATVGQHVRHILEFYICLLNGVDESLVNYDHRNRDMDIETDIKSATVAINNILVGLAGINNDQPINLEGDFGYTPDGESRHISSSLYRELAYNLEHSIHHQALIKIGLKELRLNHLLSEHFGIAPATIRFKTQEETNKSQTTKKSLDFQQISRVG